MRAPEPGSPSDSSRWRSAIAVVLAFLAAALVTYLRDPNLYRLPMAAYEDGRDFFAYFYNHRELSSVLREYNGYVSLVPNLVGFLSVRLPTTMVPYCLALFPLVVTSFGFARFAATSYRPVVASDTIRFVACLVLAMAPLGNRQFVSSTAYSIWGLLFVLVLAALRDPPPRPRPAAAAAIAHAAIVCSHPLSIVLAPIYLIRLLRGHGSVDRGYHAALLASSLLYQAFGVDTAGRRLERLWVAVERSAAFTLERVVFNPLFSDRASKFYRREGLEWRIPVIAVVVVVAVVVAIFLCRRSLRGRQRAALGFLAYVIVALTVGYVVGRDAAMDILERHAEHRYFWVQRLSFLIVLTIVADAALRRVKGGWARGGLAIVILALTGAQLARLNRVDGSKYASRVRVGVEMQRFTERVERQEKRGDGRVDAVLPRGRWSLELHRAGRPAQRQAPHPEPKSEP